jgi:hypothetical protein
MEPVTQHYDFNAIIPSLTAAEQQEFFQMLSDHARLLNKIMPEMPLVSHAANGDGNPGHPLVQLYNVWQRTKNS